MQVLDSRVQQLLSAFPKELPTQASDLIGMFCMPCLARCRKRLDWEGEAPQAAKLMKESSTD